MSIPECCGGSLSWEDEKHASWCPGYVNDLEDRLEKAEAQIETLKTRYRFQVGQTGTVAKNAKDWQDLAERRLADSTLAQNQRIAWAERARAAEENLAFAQQRAADNDLRARLGEAKIEALTAEIARLKREQ